MSANAEHRNIIGRKLFLPLGWVAVWFVTAGGLGFAASQGLLPLGKIILYAVVVVLGMLVAAKAFPGARDAHDLAMSELVNYLYIEAQPFYVSAKDGGTHARLGALAFLHSYSVCVGAAVGLTIGVGALLAAAFT